MEPVLYIIMRTDLPDCNPGKGMAQAAHAQADFSQYMNSLREKKPRGSENADKNTVLRNTLENYEDDFLDVRNFGKTIVLSANKETIIHISDLGNHSSVTTDPTYPWKNFYGNVQVTEEITCGWFFVGEFNQEDLELVENLPLHQ
jgi:hypothetical protein